MGDKKNIPTFIDKRLQERLVDRGDVTTEGLEAYLAALPDLTEEVEYVGSEDEAVEATEA